MRNKLFTTGDVVEVTQADIDAAGGWSWDCPITQAVKRQWPTARGVNTGTSTTGRNGGAIAFRLPIEAQAFVRQYDNRRFAKPFAFTLGERI